VYSAENVLKLKWGTSVKVGNKMLKVVLISIFVYQLNLDMMKHTFFMTRFALFFLFAFSIVACSSDETQYVPVPALQSPVVVDLTQIPYQKLSDYKFFNGTMKDQKPSYGVIPYQPASSLFTDYAEKKRFIWLPKGTKATYNGDGKVLEMPIGSALVKTFYYNNVQPLNTTRILETRVMIKKASGWIFANYIWNDEQTEAFFDLGGSNVDISWTHNGTAMATNYRIPSESECFTCHNNDEVVFPIGVKPQNLNVNYGYPEGSKNQLSKLIAFGYLENNLPENIVSTVDFNDTTKPLDLRARSYFDSNCAHCHQDGGHAEFYALRFPFNQTENQTNMGVCVGYNHFVPGFSGRLVAPGDISSSMVYYRLTTDEFNLMMPQLGRTVPHEEGIALVGAWISSLTDCP
jgi:uncharacterized repeat protein (TIGR03806 family)